MSRTYQQHPELFPYMRDSDPYYEDLLIDSYKIRHASNFGMNSKKLAERIDELNKKTNQDKEDK